MKLYNYDSVDKVLCHYIHKGGEVARFDGLFICTGYDMPNTIIIKKDENRYTIRKYKVIPKKYQDML